MATVPYLRRPQVGTRPETPRRIVPRTAVPEVLGAAAQGLADLAQVREREVARVDEIRANEAEVNYRRAVDDLLLNPQTGALHQSGSKALEAAETMRGRLAQSRSEVAAGLTSDRQRLAFEARAAQMEQDAMRRLDAHAGNEVQKLDDASHEALVLGDREAVAEAARTGDMASADAAIARMSNRIALYGDRKGADPEAVKVARKTARSEARALQIGALLDANRVEAAATIFSAHKDELLAAQRAKVESVLTEARDRSVTAQLATQVLAKASTQTEANAMIADLPIERRKGVRQLVEAEFDAVDRARKSDQETSYLAAANLVDAKVGTPARAAVPAALWESLTVEQRNALERRATAPANDNVKWFEFYALTPAQRGKLTAAEFQTKYWSRFDEDHRSRAEKLYRDSVSDPDGTGASSAGILTNNQRVLSTLVSMHLVTKPKQSDWTDADYEFAAVFEQQAEARIVAHEAENGRKATAAEKQQILTQLGWDLSPLKRR